MSRRGARGRAALGLLIGVLLGLPGYAGAQLPPVLPGPEPAPEPAPDSQPPADRPRSPAGATARPTSTAIRTLSNEGTFSRWAYVEHRAWAHSRPAGEARRVKRIRKYTEDGTREVLLALRQVRRDRHTPWVKVRLPMRPKGTKAWIRRDVLGGYRLVRTRLVIDRDDFEAILYERGERVWRSRIGVGKHGTDTPSGHFYVRERLNPLDENGIYGIFAFGTSAYSPTLTDWPGGGIVGIHGTNQPELIPGRISHGCVRVPNPNIRELRRLMPLGTPIEIR